MLYNTYIRVVILPAHVYMLRYIHPTLPEGIPFRRCPVYVDNKNHKNQRARIHPCTYKPLLGGVTHVQRNKIYMFRQGILLFYVGCAYSNARKGVFVKSYVFALKVTLRPYVKCVVYLY